MLLVSVLISGCENDTGNGAGDKPRFRIATLSWVGYSPIDLALEKGFFEEEGIHVELRRIDDTAARRAALSKGSVDASVDIVDSFANAVSGGVPASAVLKLDDSSGGDGIIVRKEIQSITDLKGKKVAYPPGQPSHFFLLSVLESAGMTIDDIVSEPMEADQAGAAFVSGGIDAAVTWEPWLTKASTTPHGKILTTSRETPGLIADIFTVRNDYLKEHPEVVKKFLKAWFRAIDYWKEFPEESNEIMAKALGIRDREEFEKMLKGVKYSDLEENQRFFKADSSGASPFTDLMNKANDVWSRAGVIRKPVDPGVVDGSNLVLGMNP